MWNLKVGLIVGKGKGNQGGINVLRLANSWFPKQVALRIPRLSVINPRNKVPVQGPLVRRSMKYYYVMIFVSLWEFFLIFFFVFNSFRIFFFSFFFFSLAGS